MKKIDVVIVAAVILGMILASFGGWQYGQGEVDSYKQALVSEEKAKVEALKELSDVQDKLDIAESKLEAAQRQIDIRERFGIKIFGEERNMSLGEKIGDHNYLSLDESALIFNVLSSLPQEMISSINSITVVHLPTPSAGGRYDKGGNIVIFGPPDMKGSNSTARVGFIYVLYHEIGHIIDFSVLSSEEREEFYALYYQSQDEKDFASFYGKNYPWEDFATVFASYLTDTEALLKKAEGSSLLMAKVEFVSRFFSQYYYKVDERGTIRRWRGEEETIWPYRSRTNPEIETTLFK